MLNSAVRIMLLACCTFTPWSAAAFADATGLYIRESQTELEAIQIIEMSDGQLSGRYESYSLDDKGKLASMSLGLNGSIAKGQLVINFRKSLDTLFTTQSLSGEVKGNSLMLIWEGGAGVFQKGKASERNDRLEKLNALGRQISWAREEERIEKSYREAKATIDNLGSKQSSIHATMLEARIKYDSLVANRSKRESRISNMDAMNISGNVQYQLGVEIYQIESELYSLNAEVDTLRNELDWDISSVGTDLKRASEFCSKYGESAQDLEFCTDLLQTAQTFDTLTSDLIAIFDNWATRPQ